MSTETIEAPDTEVTEPGVFIGMPESVYFGDPVPEGSLSASGAKKLLDESPAQYRYDLDNPPPPKDTFDFGHAAHQMVLGAGPEIVVIPGERWDTNKAKAEVAEARAAGKVPIKAPAMARVQAMAAELRAHKLAAKLLDPDRGRAELSMFWRDERTRVMRRARVDFLHDAPFTSGRTALVDYKSAVTANPAAFARSAPDYGYHSQAANYLDGAIALALADEPVFLFVVQQKTAPYLVSVVELDSLALRIGRHRMAKALDLYARCRETDTWPGFSDDVELVSLPQWAVAEYERESAA